MATRWDVTKAVRGSTLPSPSKVIMLVLADVADTGTAEIPAQFTPSIRVLAAETSLSASTVKTHLNALEAAGWLARKRPDGTAQWHGERTSYQLLVPEGRETPQDGPGDGLGVGREMARGGPGDGLPLGQELPTPRPGDGLGVGREMARGGPGDGHLKETDLLSDLLSDQNLAAPPAEARRDDESTNAEVDKPDTAQTILADWIDYCVSRQVIIPSRLRGQYAKTIKDALNDGITVKLIKTTLAKMLDDGAANRPSLLPNRLVAAQTGPERRGSTGNPNEIIEVNGMRLTRRNAEAMERLERLTEKNPDLLALAAGPADPNGRPW